MKFMAKVRRANPMAPAVQCTDVIVNALSTYLQSTVGAGARSKAAALIFFVSFFAIFETGALLSICYIFISSIPKNRRILTHVRTTKDNVKKEKFKIKICSVFFQS